MGSRERLRRLEKRAVLRRKDVFDPSRIAPADRVGIALGRWLRKKGYDRLGLSEEEIADKADEFWADHAGYSCASLPITEEEYGEYLKLEQSGGRTS